MGLQTKGWSGAVVDVVFVVVVAIVAVSDLAIATVDDDVSDNSVT